MLHKHEADACAVHARTFVVFSTFVLCSFVRSGCSATITACDDVPGHVSLCACERLAYARSRVSFISKHPQDSFAIQVGAVLVSDCTVSQKWRNSPTLCWSWQLVFVSTVFCRARVLWVWSCPCSPSRFFCIFTPLLQQRFSAEWRWQVWLWASGGSCCWLVPRSSLAATRQQEAWVSREGA